MAKGCRDRKLNHTTGERSTDAATFAAEPAGRWLGSAAGRAGCTGCQPLVGLNTPSSLHALEFEVAMVERLPPRPSLPPTDDIRVSRRDAFHFVDSHQPGPAHQQLSSAASFRCSDFTSLHLPLRNAFVSFSSMAGSRAPIQGTNCACKRKRAV